MKRGVLFLVILFSLFLSVFAKADTVYCDVLVVGGGTGGVAAAIQSARLGVKTCLLENTTWLGGMYTAAGIGAFDGPEQNSKNYCKGTFCASVGLFREIEEEIHKYYCPDKYPCPDLAKGSVSMSAFEPHIARSVLNDIVGASDVAPK